MSVTLPIYLALRPSGDRRTVVTGVVVSANSIRALVDIDGYGSRIEVPYTGATPRAGDVAVMVRSANRLWMLGVHGAPVAVPDPDDPNEAPSEENPKPPDAPTTTTVRLSPTATGTARGGSVRPDTGDLYQGDWTGRGINSGMAVYRARQLSGVVASCSVRIKRLDAGVFAAAAPTLRLMAQGSLVGSPTWQAEQVGPALKAGESRTVALPTSWGQALINGTAGGIGIHVLSNSPYVRLAGKAQGFMTVTLRIRSD